MLRCCQKNNVVCACNSLICEKSQGQENTKRVKRDPQVYYSDFCPLHAWCMTAWGDMCTPVKQILQYASRCQYTTYTYIYMRVCTFAGQFVWNRRKLQSGDVGFLNVDTLMLYRPKSTEQSDYYRPNPAVITSFASPWTSIVDFYCHLHLFILCRPAWKSVDRSILACV